MDCRIPLVTLGDEDGKLSFFVHAFTNSCSTVKSYTLSNIALVLPLVFPLECNESTVRALSVQPFSHSAMSCSCCCI